MNIVPMKENKGKNTEQNNETNQHSLFHEWTDLMRSGMFIHIDDEAFDVHQHYAVALSASDTILCLKSE